MKVCKYGTAVCHRHPHEVIELSELRTAQWRTPTHGCKHVVLRVVAFKPFIMMAVADEHCVLSVGEEFFYIKPVYRIGFLRPERLMHEKKSPLRIAMCFERLSDPLHLWRRDAASARASSLGQIG